MSCKKGAQPAKFHAVSQVLKNQVIGDERSDRPDVDVVVRLKAHPDATLDVLDKGLLINGLYSESLKDRPCQIGIISAQSKNSLEVVIEATEADLIQKVREVTRLSRNVRELDEMDAGGLSDEC